MLESITDDQGRRVDFDVDTGGIPRRTRTNPSYSGSTLIGYQEADYTYHAGLPVPNHIFTPVNSRRISVFPTQRPSRGTH